MSLYTTGTARPAKRTFCQPRAVRKRTDPSNRSIEISQRRSPLLRNSPSFDTFVRHKDDSGGGPYDGATTGLDKLDPDRASLILRARFDAGAACSISLRKEGRNQETTRLTVVAFGVKEFDRERSLSL